MGMIYYSRLNNQIGYFDYPDSACVKNNTYKYLPSPYLQGISTYFYNSYRSYELDQNFDIINDNINELIIRVNFMYMRDINQLPSILFEQKEAEYVLCMFRDYDYKSNDQLKKV